MFSVLRYFILNSYIEIFLTMYKIERSVLVNQYSKVCVVLIKKFHIKTPVNKILMTLHERSLKHI